LRNAQGKTSSTLFLNGVMPPKLVQIHEPIGESIKMCVDEMENENSILKDLIKELDISIMPLPIFASPITTMQPWKTLDRTPKSSSKLRGTSSLLVAVRRYVGENIKKIMYFILEAWELVINFVSLGSRITNMRKYIQEDVENDEGFYKYVVTTFLFYFWA
jgi:hypothetical protein